MRPRILKKFRFLILDEHHEKGTTVLLFEMPGGDDSNHDEDMVWVGVGFEFGVGVDVGFGR